LENQPNPVQKIINRLFLNRINIHDIPDSNLAVKEAIKEINEALIEFFENI
jgi:hypothetical protein